MFKYVWYVNYYYTRSYRLPMAESRWADGARMFSRFGAHKHAHKSVTISALAQVPSHINTHLTNVINENVQSSSKFVHNSVVVVVGRWWMATQPFFGSKKKGYTLSWAVFHYEKDTKTNECVVHWMNITILPSDSSIYYR